MRDFKEHLIKKGAQIKEALARLDKLAIDAILFVVEENEKLIGSLTDGDVRRGLLKGLSIVDKVELFIQEDPKFIFKGEFDIDKIIYLRKNNFKVIPILNSSYQIINVINFRFHKSYLPLDAVVMAGGRGIRLSPLTDDTPKPLLKIGEKSIIDYCMDRLVSFGIDNFWISVRYLGEQIVEHLGKSIDKGVDIKYLWEDEPLGTIGGIGQIKEFQHNYVLVTNSDLLTTIDYEDFFLDFIEKDADLSVATVPYTVNVPYAVLETTNNHVVSFKEKPEYTYYSNGGIYLLKKEFIDLIPKNAHYNSTDLMEVMIKLGNKVISYPMRQYWLDIGQMDDFNKAQEDIKHLHF